jgi:hypothetical protein
LTLFTFCPTITSVPFRGPWWTLQRGWLPWTDANNLPPPNPLPRLHPFRETSRVESFTPPSHPRGLLSWTDANTYNDNSLPPPAPLPVQTQLTARSGFPPRRVLMQVTRDSPPNPSHRARPLMSALPPRFVRKSNPRSSSRVLPAPPQRVSARTTCVMRVTVAQAPSCTGHNTSYRLRGR